MGLPGQEPTLATIPARLPIGSELPEILPREPVNGRPASRFPMSGRLEIVSYAPSRPAMLSNDPEIKVRPFKRIPMVK